MDIDFRFAAAPTSIVSAFEDIIRKYHVVLHTLFEKSTQQWQLIAYNPVENVEASKTLFCHKEIYDEEITEDSY